MQTQERNEFKDVYLNFRRKRFRLTNAISERKCKVRDGDTALWIDEHAVQAWRPKSYHWKPH